ncbi:uncharacterized protein B0J16DRAFT_130656 [Fusarium flagelliforme]|uniref:uncharacterized protein n=1 Tax=Fusarium flagelliforme TaxID=2675880 RepID=UPI001E8D2D95|nr:uncharacterized protein B0J16DRAFT_130656 [Fusarium flagelliforme]KAH7185413.1 hypothetical protein B0J16DRAFT_130656 [Fusarium flagelliforme]
MIEKRNSSMAQKRSAGFLLMYPFFFFPSASSFSFVSREAINHERVKDVDSDKLEESSAGSGPNFAHWFQVQRGTCERSQTGLRRVNQQLVTQSSVSAVLKE